jgi:hypothetical protein
LESNDWEEVQTLELPDSPREIVSMLLDLVYVGVIEATIDDLRKIILLAHSLYVSIPLSDDLLETLELTLPSIPAFFRKGLPKLNPRPNFQPPSVVKQPLVKPHLPLHPKIPTLKLKLSSSSSDALNVCKFFLQSSFLVSEISKNICHSLVTLAQITRCWFGSVYSIRNVIDIGKECHARSAISSSSKWDCKCHLQDNVSNTALYV